MIILKGKNLCERRKELSFKVIEAAKNKFDLQEVKCAEDSDIDRIFKIELASKYKNVDYVLEELKSSDSLYVSKALKCEWLYDSDFAHLINPDYLHHHIFPSMSLKMKTTALKIMSIYVREETRSQLFYEYCVNTEQWDIAIKFLIFTSESFKNELLNDNSKFYNLFGRVKKDYFGKFIGNSFVLAEAYGNRNRPITDLTHLYSLDEEKYLDLLEKHTTIPSGARVHGVKMSRSILKKHKDRILRKPLLYIKVLNRRELLKYSSSDDVKVYAVPLLPEHHRNFWMHFQLSSYKPILNLIKTPTLFEFIKKMFNDKYGKQEFEMSEKFYCYKYHNLIMTSEERETWALSHLQKQLNVIPEEENYRWYEYIDFAKSFKELKTQIYITTYAEKRSKMLTILVKSAKTQRDLEELFNYYYKRHVNETKGHKTNFIRAVIDNHKVLEFGDACWAAFDLLLLSLDVYNPAKNLRYDDILTTSLVYHIINNKTISEDLQVYLKRGLILLYLPRYLRQLNNEKKDFVIKYIKQFMTSIISEFESREYSDAVRSEVRQYLRRWEELKSWLFNKKGVDQYPDIVLKYMKLDVDNFQHIVGVKPKESQTSPESEALSKITEGYLLRCLKENATVIVEKLPLIIDRFSKSRKFRINLLLRKIALYFSNDIAKRFLEFFTKTLYELLPNNDVIEDQTINSIVFAIFRMRDQKIKTELMVKFAPTNPKIEHDKISRFVLYTQQAICRFQSYSRPPVPLSKTALYLKGDYVYHCDYMFNMYLANLPPALHAEFIKLLLDAPLYVQKRSLPLAFKTFEASELKDHVSKVWKKTKNVSFRKILYLLLLSKLVKEEGKTQEILYELLKELTLTIHQDDTDEVFACFSGNQMPEKFRGGYLQIAWKVVTELPEMKSNLQRKTRVIQSFAANMYLMNEDFLESLIYDHVHKILCDQKLCPEVNDDIVEQNEAMWFLTTQYIVDVSNEAKQEKSLKLVNLITKECLSSWNEDHNTETLIFQTFFNNFVKKLLQGSSYLGTKYLRLIHIFEYLLQTFENKFGIPQMYSYFWDWKLDLLMRKVIDGKTHCDKAVCINFGLALGVLIKELKDKNLYYISFSDKIYGKISSFVHHLNSMKEKTLDYVDIPVLVAYGLTLTNIFETYVLALNILPANPNKVIRNEYLEVLKKIKEENNEEFTAFLNDKFIYSDFKVRTFLM